VRLGNANAQQAGRLNPRSQKPKKSSSGRSSDLRINLLARPSHPFGQWRYLAFVPDHSGGTATEFHRLPWDGPEGPPESISIIYLSKQDGIVKKKGIDVKRIFKITPIYIVCPPVLEYDRNTRADGNTRR